MFIYIPISIHMPQAYIDACIYIYIYMYILVYIYIYMYYADVDRSFADDTASRITSRAAAKSHT